MRRVFFYLIGYGIKKLLCHKCSVRIYIIIVLLFWLLFGVLNYFVNELNYTMHYTILRKLFAMIRSGIVIPILVVAILLCFGNIEMHHNKLINSVAATTFGIYAFHDTPVFRELIWTRLLKAQEQYMSPLFGVEAIASVLLVLVISMTVEYLRQLLFKVKISGLMNRMSISFEKKYKQR